MEEPPVENVQPLSMGSLFRQELLTQTAVLDSHLAILEKGISGEESLAPMLRAAHSLKGAALIMNVRPVADLAQAIENCLSSHQGVLRQDQLKILAEVSATLHHIAKDEQQEIQQTVGKSLPEIERLLAAFLAFKEKQPPSENPLSLKKKAVQRQPRGEVSRRELPLSEPAFDASMMSLFFVDLETQTHLLTEGLLALEANAQDAQALASLMRAAHSIKGAARVLALGDVVDLARAIEKCFVAFQDQQLRVEPEITDLLLAGTDLFASLATTQPENIQQWLEEKKETLRSVVSALNGQLGETEEKEERLEIEPAKISEKMPAVSESAIKRLQEVRQNTRATKRDRILRLTADYLTRLMGLAGELLVESRWLQPFADALLQLKKSQYELSAIVDILRSSYHEEIFGDQGQEHLLELQRKTNLCRHQLAKRLEDLELFIRRHGALSDRLYREVISSRLCPFGEGVEDLPRQVRDLARQLGKKVTFEIIGRSTTIDRDILDKLQAPLAHLLRNAVDHGIETPEERIAAGKKPEGLIRLEARHRAGVLGVTITDDGRGINLTNLRKRIVEKKLVDAAMAQQLTDSELLDFLFLPGFTTATAVTDISGRGIGLNVVQSMVHDVGGQVRVYATNGNGMTFHLQLPLTLSVMRSLIVEIAGEPYAFPLARIERALVLDRQRVEIIENRQYIRMEEQNVGLVPASQILNIDHRVDHEPELSVVVLSDNFNYYGVVVDKLLGEKELVVQELDSRLGKVSDISCGALMEDGSPVLVIDVEDMVRSVDNLLSGGKLEGVREVGQQSKQMRRKRVLVVDDSITVREVECRILENEGYEVGVAVNGVDGWNLVRIEDYDLVVTDIDMPRMNGIELVRLIKNDPRLRKLPVMIVSYKERGEDRKMGLEAGADFYLAKSSFHDDSFLETVKDLLGE